MDAAATFSRRSDARVMSLVGFAHATSHFFHLVIPSLFPWLMADFGLNFTRAGSLAAAFFIVSGIGQALAGFVVDRYGAQATLFVGLALLALSGGCSPPRTATPALAPPPATPAPGMA